MSRTWATRRRGAARRASPSIRAGRVVLLIAMVAVAVVTILYQGGTPEMRMGTASVGDGDSLTIGGERIRLVGIDAPELRQTCRRDGRDYACGREAREALRLLAAGPVECTGFRRDRYGRLLATCHAGGLELNRTLVEHGWAVGYGAYEDAEQLARSARRGIWAGEFERPRDWRVLHGEMADIEIGLIGRLIGWLRSLVSRG